MKYFLIGFNASGKQAVMDDLKSMNIKTGNIFRSIDMIPSTIYSLSSVVYSDKDVSSIFENKSYIFMKETKQAAVQFFEGLSFYEYDNNDVFMITPEHFNLVPKFDKDVVFIWLDANNNQRRNRFLTEKRKYNFQSQELIEKQDVQDFINRINDNQYLYFVNEEPSRVAAIVYSLIKHPELLDVYKNRFK